MDTLRIVTIDAMEMLPLSVLVIFFGFFLNQRVRVLQENFIPAAVTGGILFSLLSWLAYAQLGIELEFDMRLRDLLLLVFFSTIGLSVRIGSLASGGRALVILIVVAALFLVLQNTVGVVLAMQLGVHPAYGLLGGSISFAGGHATAIAWGAVAEDAGFAGASEIALAFATFGLIAGGLVGGPIARRIMATSGLEGSTEEQQESAAAEVDESVASAGHNAWLYPALSSLALLAVCVSLGDLVNRLLSDQTVRLPGFLTAMFVGILIANLADAVRRPVARETLGHFGEVSLHIFLAMSMMTIELWALGNAASGILLVLAAQILLVTVFAIWVVYRLMGRDYDAVVISVGFAGLGLGATPVAIANMDAVTARYGPSSKAFLIVPLVGAFFIDLLNAGTINLFIGLIRDHLV